VGNIICIVQPPNESECDVNLGKFTLNLPGHVIVNYKTQNKQSNECSLRGSVWVFSKFEGFDIFYGNFCQQM